MDRNGMGKAIALFVVLTMLLTALTTITFVIPTTRANPTIGVNEWQSNYKGGRILNMSTESLYYGNTVDLKFNGSAITGNSYLYKPNYGVKWHSSLGRYVYYVNWTLVDKKISPTEAEPQLDDILLDRAGLWLVITDPDKPPSLGYNANAKVNLSNMSYYDQSEGKWIDITGWFWVNWTSWNIDLSTTEVTYDANNSLTITVTYSNGDTVTDAFWIDVWYLKNDASDFNNASAELVYHKEVKASDEGVWEISGEFMYRLTHDTGAGVYQIVAHRDVNPGHTTNMYGSEGWGDGVGFNNTFGNETIWSRFGGAGARYILNCSGEVNTLNETTYDWDTCGPFDPPEYLAWKNFTVKANEPVIDVKNETQYFNFSCAITGNVTLTVKDTSGHYIDVENHGGENCVYLFNSSRNLKRWKPIDRQHYNITVKDANITIGPNITDSYGWGHSRSGVLWAEKGKIYVVVSVNLTGDDKPEWNGTATFNLVSAPALEIVLIDDDGPISDDDKDAVIPQLWPTWIEFSVVQGSEDKYLENPKNITISGNALFLENGMTLEKYNETFDGKVVKLESNGVWNVSIIPTMGVDGGKITITAKTKDHTAEKVIQVGGTKLNGSIVDVTPSSFIIGTNTTITVTVTGPHGVVKYPNANVYLFYLNISDDGLLLTGDGMINWTYGGGTTAGEYFFFLNETQQTDNQTYIYPAIKAPRYIVACVLLPNVGYGYGYTVMKPKSDLGVEVSDHLLMAGEYSTFWINVSIVNETGGKAGTPDKDGMHVVIYNETGENVTGKFGWPDWDDLTDDVTFDIAKAITEPGIYTIYAYNNTHTSEGHNATIEVMAVDVTTDFSELIWRYDDNVTVTFNVKWNDQPVNGTLKIYGISDEGTYNLTWVNNSYIEVDVVEGVAIVHNITAGNLTGASIKNITFQFKPEETGSDYANATGKLPVRIPHVTATPNMVALGEQASVEVLATGRGQPLEGVNISLVGPGNIQLNATTDSQGIARFAFLPTATGFIDIYAEGRKTTEQIEVTSHYLVITAPAQVYEDDEFEVTVKDETGTPVENAQVTINGNTKTTNAEGKVTFTLSVAGNLNSMQYTITAKKAGYRSAEKSIVVINVPQLYIYVKPSGVIKSGQKVTVGVTSDTGQVYGVKVTVTKDGEKIFEGTVTSPDGVTFPAPTVKEKTTFTITVEKDGYKSATAQITIEPGGIPGFELVTLIAAIGIAFILLRRRR